MISLKKETHTIATAGLVGILVCASTLALFVSPAAGLLWALASASVWLLVWHQTYSRLALNRADTHSACYADLGWANRMTIGRGWLIAASAGFLFIPAALQHHELLIWIAAAAYSIAAIFDRVDGFIARKTRRSSLLGAELDTVFDALGLLIAPLLALQLGKIHASYLLVSIAYYLFVLGIYVRRHHQKPVYPLAPSKLRRTLAGFQMAYVAVVLWPPFQAEVTVLTGFGFMLPLLAGFLVDWFVVSGRITPDQPGTARRFRRLHSLTGQLLLPAIRLISTSAVIYIAMHMPWDVPELIVAGACVVMMLAGFAARTGAMLLLMLLAWTVPLAANHPVMIVALMGASAVVLLGSGGFTLWQADGDWVNRQDGA